MVRRFVCALRFVELSKQGNDDPEKRFLVWENTVIVKARNLDHAYDKIVSLALGETEPYKGGPEPGVDVQWVLEGVSELLPIYERLEDGAEIMWSEYTKKLEAIRKLIRKKAEFHQ